MTTENEMTHGPPPPVLPYRVADPIEDDLDRDPNIEKKLDPYPTFKSKMNPTDRIKFNLIFFFIKNIFELLLQIYNLIWSENAKIKFNYS